MSPAEQSVGRGESDPYKVVSIRLRWAEYEGFSSQARALGLTSNLALRIAARRIGGFLEIDQTMRRQLETVVRDIGEISRNVVSLHAVYNETGKADPSELAEQRAAFGQEFARLDSLLRAVLNVSRRRSDGLRMLEDSMK
jgi:type IV secretion system T-DNA border endonuclease VirD1